MKNWLIKNLFIAQAIFCLLFGFVLSPLTPNAIAADDDKWCPDTSIIGTEEGEICNDEGGGIKYILFLALRILTWGVGIIAVGGIVVAAIIYATAGGDDSKVKLAKTMIFNIAIGVILYVLLYAILNFILPNQINSSGDGSTPLFEQ